MSKFNHRGLKLVLYDLTHGTTVKLGDKERIDKEKIGVKEPFLVTSCQLLHKD